ncbi:hypothetical protein ZIOFF_027902 [Zingiber officinale]|uniref:WAT1-related protein n=1 Tax=Zingiber officinale TaxID=94328 RepID=A0A8J5H545_ZINOF|nr:hypothetical protein ZIOFF_027902 [Zingiber officinale]
MLAVDMALAVMNIMIKKAIQEGMNKLVFITLRHLVATLFMAPITFLHERMEVVRTKTKEGVAKALDTIVCFIGVLVLILYKGVALNKSINTSTMGLRVSKKYPHLYSCTVIVFFLSFLQAAVLSLATQRGAAMWVLKKKLEIATVIYSGAVGSGLGFLGMSWCMEQRGPVFTTAFTPLIQIAAAVIDFAFLHEVIYLGSVLGVGSGDCWAILALVGEEQGSPQGVC